MKKRLTNGFFIFFPLLIGFVIGIIVKDNIDYNSLLLPPFAPPKILFPIVWSILYFLLGISYYIYRKNLNDKKTIVIYYVQLIMNFLWSILFFSLKWRFISILWIVFIDFFLIYLIKLFFLQKKISAYINIPYLCWCFFATYLTIGIYFLN